MLLSRNDILAAYDSRGREMLQLFTGRATAADAQFDAARSLSATDEVEFADSEELELEDGNADQLFGVLQDVIVRRAMGRRLQDMATHDPLTGLSNRTHFHAQLENSLTEARHIAGKIAFVLIDLDHFRDLNNTLGHQAGDAILLEVGRRIQALASEADAIARFGGDEFALVMKGISSSDDIMPMVGRLLEAVTSLVTDHSPKIRLSASLGVALFPDHGADINELLQNADIALYRAKAEGRGQAQIFAPQMRAALTERLQQMSTFRSLLEKGKVRPYYQPQIQLTDRRCHGFEALARWILPNGDLLSPAHFPNALSDPEAAVMLGEHMLLSISNDLLRWQKANMPPFKVSINVTAPELRRGDYPRKVAELFASKGVPLSRLTVEVTESVLLDDKATQVAQALSDLRQMGVSISLDDFGTGFASLTHLKTYTIDEIKIDRSFIAGLNSNSDDQAIVRATLVLARSLRIKTVAEGLESESQLRFLRTLGCDYGQGYFFSPAVPAAQAERYFWASPERGRRYNIYQPISIEHLIRKGAKAFAMVGIAK
ncbi:EAL domain-containing protein [Microvirga sp. BT350]|uniref:EAL domain-containing protein n=2 Tax=Microvirga alba TaxID=2791025 RepID=A0A931FMK0_9HYPH|nr:EAL domain-containing protein [Microvirga alba]